LLRTEAELAGVKQENLRLSSEIVDALEERLSRIDNVSTEVITVRANLLAVENSARKLRRLTTIEVFLYVV